MRHLSVLVLLLLAVLSSIGQETKSFWEGVEIEFDFNPTISFGMGTADYTRDVLPYLTPQNDKMNLLQDEYSPDNPINIEAYGNDYGDCCWDAPMPNSLLFAVKIQKSISTQYVKDLFYLGAFAQYGKNSIGKTLRNPDYGNFSDKPYRNTVYFLESGKKDTVEFQYNNRTDTLTFNRAKLATLDNPRNTAEVGLSFKTIFLKSKRQRFRLFGEVSASAIWATSNKINVYTRYYDFENFDYYEYVYSDNATLKDNYDSYLYDSKHLNNPNIGERQLSIETPRLSGSSFSIGAGFDYKLFKKAPLNFGVHFTSSTQTYKRKGETVGENRMLTVGYSIIYTLL